MWLLSTDRAELHYFSSPEDVPGGYAILSHVWSKSPEPPEQTFQDIRRLHRRRSRWKLGSNPLKKASPKIRESCKLAARHGFKWLWIDTCCIDKTSSAELSEAINSMYRYYSLAEVCYAYLSDVRPVRSGKSDANDHDPSVLGEAASDPAVYPWPLDTFGGPFEVQYGAEDEWDSRSENGMTTGERFRARFRGSKWHTRGWTLQELLAPELVVFLSADWDVLGTKAELADLLEQATSIPRSVLALETAVADVSVAQRMSWAARRETTRLEDEAYCLMGIFGVNMPTLYGEGRRAFQRLQEEIMKQSPDTSLFAWGEVQQLVLADDRRYWQEDRPRDSDSPTLFASSPSAFVGSQVVFTPPSTRRHRNRPKWDAARHPTFSVTSHGVLASLPIISLSSGELLGIVFSALDDTQLALRLERSPDATSPAGPLYRLCSPRLAFVFADPSIHPSLSGSTSSPRPQWKELYIAQRTTPTVSVAPSGGSGALNRTLTAPFRVPRATLTAMRANGARVVLPPNPAVPLDWRGCPPLALRYIDGLVGLVVRLGCCCSCSRPQRHRTPSTRSALLLPTDLGRLPLPSPIPFSGLPERPGQYDRLDTARARLACPPHHNSGEPWATVERCSDTVARSDPRDHAQWTYDAPPPAPGPTHDCNRDHVRSWADGARIVELPANAGMATPRFSVFVRLSFRPSRLCPGALELHLEHVDLGTVIGSRAELTRL
ncbi:HET-domain-containing protein [Epithele typhae]|uniref:HET-domain-containing protein n=1 Tax=Epithele typhae TaxID=378194 RepID=UPI002008507B|nr:HET-domain-containing protein [Epithele typhae]KAH9942154.1 HET-domain-containing protein [Epithele typhae]